MKTTPEEKLAQQKEYYTQLNEILVKVQNKEFSKGKGEDAVGELNDKFPLLNTKASTCIIEAMTDEYVNFDENSNC